MIPKYQREIEEILREAEEQNHIQPRSGKKIRLLLTVLYLICYVGAAAVLLVIMINTGSFWLLLFVVLVIIGYVLQFVCGTLYPKRESKHSKR